MALQKGPIDLGWVVVRVALEGSKELVLLSCKPALSEQSREGKQSWRVQLRRNAAECSRVTGGCRWTSANEIYPLLSLEQGLEGEEFLRSNI